MRDPQRINSNKTQKEGLATFLFHNVTFLLLTNLSFPSSYHSPLPYVYFPSPMCFSFLSSLILLFTWGEMNYRCSSSSRSSEVDDEPPCMEEIDYSADSCSDPDHNFTELDRQIQECSFTKEEEEEKEEGTGWRRRSVLQS